MSKSNQKRLARHRRKAHIRKTVRGTAARPRLSVFRSAAHIYAQVVDDVSGRTIVAANTLQDGLKGEGDSGNVAPICVGLGVGLRTRWSHNTCSMSSSAMDTCKSLASSPSAPSATRR